MTKPTKKSHPSDVFDHKRSIPVRGVYRIAETPEPAAVKPALKKPGKAKTERLELYKIWAEIVKSRVNFQALSLARGPGKLFHEHSYMLQADFGTPGHLLVTLYITKIDAMPAKMSHDELRRERKIWLLPALEIEKDIHGKETVLGINVVHATNHKFGVDPGRAFLTFDIETDTVPSQKDLDRLFTKKPPKTK